MMRNLGTERAVPCASVPETCALVGSGPYCSAAITTFRNGHTMQDRARTGELDDSSAYMHLRF